MKGYEHSASDELILSMEDYLGMVRRMEEEGDPIRISSLAANLHVRPLSASKMLDNLRKTGYIDSKKYGSIMITEKGHKEGRYLLYRHQVLQGLLCTLNHTEGEPELVEEAECFISRRTVANMEQALPFLRPKNGIAGKMG